MMGREAPETCWATLKHQVISLWNCCILLVDLFELFDDTQACKRQSCVCTYLFHQNMFTGIYVEFIFDDVAVYDIIVFWYRVWQQDEASFPWLSRRSVCTPPQDWETGGAELFTQMQGKSWSSSYGTSWTWHGTPYKQWLVAVILLRRLGVVPNMLE